MRRHVASLMHNNIDINLITFVLTAESKYSMERASFEVYRARGTFGHVTVAWNVTAYNGANTALDVSPISGQVTFSEGETSKNIIIDSLPDMVSRNFRFREGNNLRSKRFCTV